MKQEKYVAIQLSKSNMCNVPSTRYISSIDEHWYQTTNTPIYIIPESKLDEVKELLRNHFLYYATFIYEDGKREEWDRYANGKKISVEDMFNVDVIVEF